MAKDMLPQILRDQLEKMSLTDLTDKIETYGFVCAAGPLTDTIHWIELKGRIALMMALIPDPRGKADGQQRPTQGDHGNARTQTQSQSSALSNDCDQDEGA